MKKIACSIVLTALLAGCATPMVWDKSGTTQEAFNKDSYECERDARQSGYYGTGLAAAVGIQNFFNRCMNSKGYTLQPRK